MQTATNPGYKTTEFWTAAVAALVGILLMRGVLTAQQAQDLNQQTQIIAGALVTIVSSVSYSLTRLAVKRSYFKSLAPDPVYAPLPIAPLPYSAPSAPSYATTPASTGVGMPCDAPWLLASV